MSAVQGRLAEELRLQARFCAATGSPFYGELLDVMAELRQAGVVFGCHVGSSRAHPARMALACASRRLSVMAARRPRIRL